MGSNFLATSAGCNVSVEIGPHSCEIVTVDDFEILCRVSVDASQTPVGRFPVSVRIPTAGKAVGQSDEISILLTSTVTKLVPSAGSLIGGTELNISGRGLTANSALIRIMVGSTECDVASATPSGIRCIVQMQESESDGEESAVEVFLGGQKAACGTPGGDCQLTMSDAATPKLRSVSPSSVTAGTHLVIHGSNLPIDKPTVFVGPFECVVVVHNTSTVICE
eukprot:1979545-Rhodomonas_salina.1